MWSLAKNRWSFWLRGLVYGTALAMLSAMAVAFGLSALHDEYSYSPDGKGVSRPRHSWDLIYDIIPPVIAPLGVLVGVAFADQLWRRRNRRLVVQTTPAVQS